MPHLQPGDHLVVSRTFYTHHGLYLGDGKVIHYSGLADGLRAGDICITSLAAFAAKQHVTVRQHVTRVYDAQTSIERAYSRLGEDKYNVITNNCEHFVTWCVMGLAISQQVNSVLLGAAEVTLSNLNHPLASAASRWLSALNVVRAVTHL